MTTQRLLLAEPPDSSIPTAAEELRETFRVLDVVASGWIVVLSFTTTAPPSSPQQGDAYLVPAGATGAWLGHQNHLAIFTVTGWIFRSPRYGWIAVVADQNAPYGRIIQYAGTQWAPWILPATQVSFDPDPDYFAARDLQTVMQDQIGRMLDAEAELLDHETRITALEAGGGGGGSGGNVTPDTHPVSSNAANDEFEGAAIDLTGARFAGANAWAWRNQGTAVVTLADGSAVIAVTGVAGDNLRILEQAAPSGNYKIRCKVSGDFQSSGNGKAGLALVQSSSGKVITAGPTYNGGANKTEIARFGSVTSFTSSILAPTDMASRTGLQCNWQYVEIEHNGTTYTFRISATGVDGTFFSIGTEAEATFFGGAADKIGIFGGSTADSKAIYDWFRRIS